MKTETRYSPEVRERAVGIVLDPQDQHELQCAASVSIAAKICCTQETLQRWVRRYERDHGIRESLITAERERIRKLEREVRELRQVNDFLRKASAFLAQGGGRPPVEMIAFIDAHRAAYGVEPIRRVPPISPSTCVAAKDQDPHRPRERSWRKRPGNPGFSAHSSGAPGQRHRSENIAILANRHQVYADAQRVNPKRWPRQTHNWTSIQTISLTPPKEHAQIPGSELAQATRQSRHLC